ncbi:agmatinase, mitochondrial [Trichonephila clavipes]|nr:agmatinase, mitochondrial [Trichonephila clavipes]
MEVNKEKIRYILQFFFDKGENAKQAAEIVNGVYGADTGFKVILAQECWHNCMSPVMDDVRKLLGDGPVYVSLDIDALDPCYAPGTGQPEIGGLTSIQMQEIIRGLKGLNIVGGDLVEVRYQFSMYQRELISIEEVPNIDTTH